MSGTNHRQFSFRTMILLVVLGFLGAAIYRFESTSPLLFLLGRICALGTMAAVFISPRRWVIVPLMLLMVTMPDLTQVVEDIQDRGIVPAATAWQIGIGPTSPAFIVMGVIMVAFVRLYDRKLHRGYRLVIFYFCLVPVVASAVFGYALEGPGRFATDAKLVAFFCAGLLIFNSYYRQYPDELLRNSQLFLALSVGVVALDAARLLLGLAARTTQLSYINLSLDSTKGLAVAVMFWLVARIAAGRSLVSGSLAGVVTLSVLLAYQTRWLVVALLMGTFLVLLLLGWKRLIALMLAGSLVSVATPPFLQRFFPDVWEVTATRFRFISEIDRNTNLLEVESARTGAIYNSLRLLWEKRSVLTGLGYGSWYTDAYSPMPNLTVGAFDEESLSTGRYYRIHDFVFHFIFKFGLIGLLLYTYVFVRPLLTIWQGGKTVLGRRSSREIAVVIFGLMPMVLTQFWFTGKGLLFSAWFVVTADCWAARFRRMRTESAAMREVAEAGPADQAIALPHLPDSMSTNSPG